MTIEVTLFVNFGNIYKDASKLYSFTPSDRIRLGSCKFVIVMMIIIKKKSMN